MTGVQTCALPICVYKEMKDILPIEDDFLYEEFDVPKPANYGQLKADAEAKQKADAEAAAQAQKDMAAMQKQQTKLFDKISPIRLFDFFVKAPASIGASANKSTNFTRGEVIYLAEQAQADFNISEIFFTALRNIYEEKVNVNKDIEPNLWQYTADKLHAAIDEGISVESTQRDKSFTDLLKKNLSIFSAFKTYAQQQELSRLLLDKNGELKPFNQFLTDSKPVIGKYNENWLQTEYDTAVLRSRIAQQWQEFEVNADLFPNLKWLESTSVEKRAFHRKFSDIPIILPINHPFWLKHRPGDLWNCKCGVTSTNEPETQAHLIPDVDFQAAPGLDNNPAIDGKIFSNTHPIIANADKAAVKAVKKFMAERVKSDVVLRVRLDKKPTNDNQITDEIKQRRKYLKDISRKSLVGSTVKHPSLKSEINFTGVGIKEFLNQPHKYYADKNELVTDLKLLIEKSKYIGKTSYHKPNPDIVASHIFEIKINGDKSWIIVRENKDGTLNLYSISDNPKVKEGTKRK